MSRWMGWWGPENERESVGKPMVQGSGKSEAKTRFLSLPRSFFLFATRTHKLHRRSVRSTPFMADKQVQVIRDIQTGRHTYDNDYCIANHNLLYIKYGSQGSIEIKVYI